MKKLCYVLALVFVSCLLFTTIGAAGQKPDKASTGKGQDKVEACHITGTYDFGYGDVPIGHVIEISESAYQAHINHGDPEYWDNLILPDGSEVCLHEELHEEYNTIFKLTDSSSFQGTLIKQIGIALAKGAISEIGGDTMGKILDLLGWGDSDNSDEQTALETMDGKLDEIIAELSKIEDELVQLLLELDITTKELLVEVANPTDEISDINTQHNKLALMVDQDSIPGQADQDDLEKVAEDLDVAFNMPSKVEGIYYAIRPVLQGDEPILNEYTGLLMDQIRAGSGTFADAYLSLEHYMSQLAINQLKGVNLLVEAYNIGTSSGITASTYLDWYNESMLKEEIGNPGNGVSFMYNVYRLALATIDPLPTSGSTYAFPNTTKEFLKRALFYQHTALHGDQNEGLHVLSFKTQDSDYVRPTLSARNRQTGEVYTLKLVSTTTDVPGNIYDKWIEDAHLSPGVLYTVLHYSGADADMPVGEYQIGQNETTFYGIYGSVDSYNDEYILASEDDDLDSTHNFGWTMLFLRSYMNKAKIFTHWTSTLHDTITDCNGEVNTTGGADSEGGYSLPFELKGRWNNDDGTLWNDDDTFSGYAELRHYMRYDGDEKMKVYVDYSAEVTGAIHITSWENDFASAGIHFGVWDSTAGERVSAIQSSTYIEIGQDQFSAMNSEYDLFSKGTASFVAIPGHLYRTYYFLKVHAYTNPWMSDDVNARSTLKNIFYEYYRFE